MLGDGYSTVEYHMTEDTHVIGPRGHRFKFPASSSLDLTLDESVGFREQSVLNLAAAE